MIQPQNVLLLRLTNIGMKNAHFVLWVCKFFKSDLSDIFQRIYISQNNFFDAKKGRLQISAVARHDPCKQKQTTAKI